MLVLTDINVNQRKKSGNYLDCKPTELTLADYDTMTMCFIRKYAPKRLQHYILRDEDAVDYVRHAIMEGTCQYNPGLGCALSTYHIYCAKWAMMRWAKKWNERWMRDGKQRSTDYKANGTSLINLLDKSNSTAICSSTTQSPEHTMREDDAKRFVKKMFETAVLTDAERKCLTMQFLECITQADIARELGISREAVRQNVERGKARLAQQYDYDEVPI